MFGPKEGRSCFRSKHKPSRCKYEHELQTSAGLYLGHVMSDEARRPYLEQINHEADAAESCSEPTVWRLVAMWMQGHAPLERIALWLRRCLTSPLIVISRMRQAWRLLTPWHSCLAFNLRHRRTVSTTLTGPASPLIRILFESPSTIQLASLLAQSPSEAATTHCCIRNHESRVVCISIDHCSATSCNVC